MLTKKSNFKVKTLAFLKLLLLGAAFGVGSGSAQAQLDNLCSANGLRAHLLGAKDSKACPVVLRDVGRYSNRYDNYLVFFDASNLNIRGAKIKDEEVRIEARGRKSNGRINDIIFNKIPGGSGYWAFLNHLYASNGGAWMMSVIITGSSADSAFSVMPELLLGRGTNSAPGTPVRTILFNSWSRMSLDSDSAINSHPATMADLVELTEAYEQEITNEKKKGEYEYCLYNDNQTSPCAEKSDYAKKYDETIFPKFLRDAGSIGPVGHLITEGLNIQLYGGMFSPLLGLTLPFKSWNRALEVRECAKLNGAKGENPSEIDINKAKLYYDGKWVFCRAPVREVPKGWSQYESWGSTEHTNGCWKGLESIDSGKCNYGSEPAPHSWSNKDREWCHMQGPGHDVCKFGQADKPWQYYNMSEHGLVHDSFGPEPDRSPQPQVDESCSNAGGDSAITDEGRNICVFDRNAPGVVKDSAGFITDCPRGWKMQPSPLPSSSPQRAFFESEGKTFTGRDEARFYELRVESGEFICRPPSQATSCMQKSPAIQLERFSGSSFRFMDPGFPGSHELDEITTPSGTIYENTAGRWYNNSNLESKYNRQCSLQARALGLHEISQGQCDYSEIFSNYGHTTAGHGGCGGETCFRIIARGSAIVKLGCFKE